MTSSTGAPAHAEPAATPLPATTTLLVRAPRRPGPLLLALALAAALGLVLGALTEVAQGLLPDAVAFAANSVAAWTGLAAAASALALAVRGPARSRRGGASLALASGLISMEGLVAGYYLWAALVSGTPHSATSTVLWTLAGLVGGPLAGAAAWGWRSRPRWTAALGVAVLAAVFGGEGLHAVATTPWYRTSGLVEVGVGVVLLWLAPRRARWRAALLAVAATAGAASCWVVLERLVDAGLTRG